MPVIIASRRRTPSSAKQNRELHRLVEVSSAAIARTMNLMGIILSVVALLLMSSAASRAVVTGARRHSHFVPILLQKSFSTTDHNFSRLLVRFSDKYVRDLVSQ